MGKKSHKKRSGQIEQTPIKPAFNIEPFTKALWISLLVAVCTLGIVLRIIQFPAASNRSPDEMVYTQQAEVITQRGLSGVASMVGEYNANPDLWKYPPPYRIGYLIPTAAIINLAGQNKELAGVCVSTAASIISLILVAWFGTRFLNRWIALAAVVFMSFSPVELAIARRAWQDALIGLVGLLIIYAGNEIASKPNRKIWFPLFALFGYYAVLIKESLALVYLLYLLWVIYILVFKRHSYIAAFSLVVISGFFSAMAVATLMWSSGGSSQLFAAIGNFRSVMATAEYGRLYCSGPWYRLIQGIWILSPIATILCTGATLWILGFIKNDHAMEPGEKTILTGAAFIIIGYGAVLSILPNLINLRYISPVSGVFSILAAAGLWRMAILIKKSFPDAHFIAALAAVVILIGSALYDHAAFENLIVKTEIRDLSIRLLEEARNQGPL